jgi:hypothetical protein
LDPHPTAQTFAAAHNDPITDAVAISPTLAVLFEEAAMYHHPTVAWRNSEAMLKEYFIRADTEYHRTATAQTPTGYHGAHAITNTTPMPDALLSPNKYRSIHYYCHSHGYTKNPKHTSDTCTNRKANHQVEATGDNLMGGCPNMYVPRSRSTQPQSHS